MTWVNTRHPQHYTLALSAGFKHPVPGIWRPDLAKAAVMAALDQAKATERAAHAQAKAAERAAHAQAKALTREARELEKAIARHDRELEKIGFILLSLRVLRIAKRGQGPLIGKIQAKKHGGGLCFKIKV